jgi:hypothetical protein
MTTRESDRGWTTPLLVLALVFFALLAFEVCARVRFPWDTYIWSESPFLTNMLRLNTSHSIYGPPSDANSFVYSPGLEYLCYVLLHPIGRDLDVRFCRGVVVAAGLIGSIVSGRFGGALLSELGADRRDVRSFVWFGTALCALVLGTNFTADVCHPDTLMMAHIVLTYSLWWRAATRGGMGRGLVAILFGSLGILVKQTAAGTGVAALVALLVARQQYRTPRRAIALAGTTAMATGLSAWVLLGSPNARFWTFELLRRQDIDWQKLTVFRIAIANDSHRLLLYVLTPIAWAWLYDRSERTRAIATSWLAFLIFACAPALSGYLKTMGSWNNLGALDVWCVLLVAPVLWYRLVARRRGDHEPAPGVFSTPTTVGLSFLLVMTVFPTRAGPSPANYAAGAELDATLSISHAAGARVLLAHGTSALLHAGYRDVPFDRANSVLELIVGKSLERANTLQRLAARYYDVIYLDVPEWYGPVLPLITAGYEEIAYIRSASARPETQGTELLSDTFGLQGGPKVWDFDVHVYKRRATTP